MNLAQRIGQEIKALYLALTTKVDIVVGKQLSTEDYTTAEKLLVSTAEQPINKNIANGYAGLDGSALIPSSLLPSYVDDVLEFATFADLPVVGESGKIYIVVADEASGGNTSSYRWATTIYALVSDSMSASDIKALYESNLDTNAYTDLEKGSVDISTSLNTIAQTIPQAINEMVVNLDAHELSTAEHGVSIIAGLNEIQSFTNKIIDDISNIVGANHIHYPVRNQSGVLIPKGTVVYASATQPGTDYVVVLPVSDPQTQVAIGITHSDVINNGTGLCMNTGVSADSINTSGFSVGAILYPDSTGGLTDIKPISGQYQACAVVLRSHATQGTLLIEFTEPKYIASTSNSGYVQLNDTLTSTSDTQALTANQGKVLNDRLAIVETSGVQEGDAVTLTGDVSGSSTFDIDGNVSITTTIADDSHNHTILTVTGLQGALDLKLDSSLYTATDVLTKMKTVDGHLSGLDADLLDGMEPLALPISTATQTTLDLKADLVNGLIPSSQLPSYVDAVVEVATYALLPVTGEASKVYIVVADETLGGNTSTYRWADTVYALISDTLSALDVKNLYLSNLDTNNFSDVLLSKLNAIEANATADQVWGEIGGTLSNQTDLQGALNGKATLGANADFSDLTLSGNIISTALTNATTNIGSLVAQFNEIWAKTLKSVDSLFLDSETGISFKIAGVSKLIISNTNQFIASVHNEIDLGSVSRYFKDIWGMRIITPLVENPYGSIRIDSSTGMYLDGGTGSIIFQHNGANSFLLNQSLDFIPNTVGTGGLGTSVRPWNAANINTPVINGFTTLGTGAPKIKMKKLIGTTAATEGAEVAINHGVTGSKIIAVDIRVESATATAWFPDNIVTVAVGSQYEYYWGTLSVVIKNHPTNSENILSKPITVLITYEE